MPSIYVTDQVGQAKQVDYEVGYSLMEVLRDAGYQTIQALCGGCCSCATCHVYIDVQAMAELPVIEDDEKMLMEFEEHYDELRSRLSCQIELTEAYAGLQISLVPST